MINNINKEVDILADYKKIVDSIFQQKTEISIIEMCLIIGYTLGKTHDALNLSVLSAIVDKHLDELKE